MNNAQRIERIAGLYRRLEDIRQVQLHRAAAEVDKIIAVQHAAESASTDEAITARTALAAGDAQGWMLAEAGRDLIGLRSVRFQQERLQLEEQRQKARDVFLQSRMERQQMEHVAAVQRAASSVIESRRLQAETDDRFLSRRQWMQSHTAIQTRAQAGAETRPAQMKSR